MFDDSRSGSTQSITKCSSWDISKASTLPIIHQSASISIRRVLVTQYHLLLPTTTDIMPQPSPSRSPSSDLGKPPTNHLSIINNSQNYQITLQCPWTRLHTCFRKSSSESGNFWTTSVRKRDGPPKNAQTSAAAISSPPQTITRCVHMRGDVTVYKYPFWCFLNTFNGCEILGVQTHVDCRVRLPVRPREGILVLLPQLARRTGTGLGSLKQWSHERGDSCSACFLFDHVLYRFLCE